MDTGPRKRYVPGTKSCRIFSTRFLADSNKFGYFEDETTAPESGPEGAETSADLQSYVTIILNLKDSFSPQEGSVLWALAGGDPGPVSYTGGTAFTINARCTNTLAFLEDAGWDIASLNHPTPERPNPTFNAWGFFPLSNTKNKKAAADRTGSQQLFTFQ